MRTLELSPETQELIFEAGSPRFIDGKKKLEQDLRAVIIEQLNSDPYTDGFGSDMYSLIGDTFDPITMEGIIINEVTMAIERLQTFLAQRLNSERWSPWNSSAGYLHVLSQSREEIIQEINTISVEFTDRSAFVSITVTTEAQEQIIIPGNRLVIRF